MVRVKLRVRFTIRVNVRVRPNYFTNSVFT